MTYPTANCPECHWINPHHREDCAKFAAHPKVDGRGLDKCTCGVTHPDCWVTCEHHKLLRERVAKEVNEGDPPMYRIAAALERYAAAAERMADAVHAGYSAREKS